MFTLRSSAVASAASSADRPATVAGGFLGSLRIGTAMTALALGLALAPPSFAAANPSDASAAISMLPVAISVVAPVAVLSAGASFVVVAVETTAKGTVWVLQRASDGVKVSVEFAAGAVSSAAASAGTAVTVSVIGTGYVLSALGEAIAFIPNEIGASLLHNERVTGPQRVTR